MEVAGAAATLLTLIGFTLQSLKTVYGTTSSIRDGPQMLAKLTIAAKELETVLDQLSKLAHDCQPSQQSAEQDIWDSLSQSVVHCRADIQRLEKEVGALGAVKSDRLVRKVWKRVKTSLKDKDFERMWTTVQDHVGVLTTQLTIVESRRNTAHENNSVLRHETVNSSLQDCVSQMLLQSDGIKAHMAEIANNVQTSIEDLNAQARGLAKFPTQMLDALGAATQSIGSQLEANTNSSHKHAHDITQVLGSRLDDISELSASQYGTIGDLLRQIQKTLNEKLSISSPNISLRSPSPARDANQEWVGLLKSIDRLGALVFEPGTAQSSEAAEAVIQELELILDFLVKQAIAKASSVPGTKRKRIEDETDLALTTTNVKKMRGLLSLSQSVDMAQIGRHDKPSDRRYARVGSQYSRTVWDMQECTAVIFCRSRPKKAAPHRQGFNPRNPIEWFEGTVSLLPRTGPSRKKLLLSFLQRFSSSGFTSINPSLSFHALLPDDSEIFCAIEDGDMTYMLELLNDKEASLTDCDVEGRSLLSYATWHRRLDICRYLIDQGAYDIDSVEPGMGIPEMHVCLLEQYLGNDYEVAVKNPDDFNESLDMRRLLLELGADPTVPSYAISDDGGSQSVLLTTLETSTDEGLKLFLRSAQPYIDLMAKDNQGNNALTFLLDMAANSWMGFPGFPVLIGADVPDIPSKVSTLLRHGASPDLEGSSYFHRLGREQFPAEAYGDILDCFCILIKGGADIYAIDSSVSVTEALHFCRHGQLWEQVLELCGLNVGEVYAMDHNRGSYISDDLYAPGRHHPRIRGPMNIQAYHDKCKKGLLGCASTHRSHKSITYRGTDYDEIRYTWTGKCRWPSGMIHEEHDSGNEASDDNSSEIEEEDRVRTASDCSDHSSDTEDDSDEEAGGVQI